MLVHVVFGAHVEIASRNDGPFGVARLKVPAGQVQSNQASGAGSVNRYASVIVSVPVATRESLNNNTTGLCQGHTHLGPLISKKWLMRLLNIARPDPTVKLGVLSSGSLACMSL
jgi:hypothetical protein